MCAIIAGVINIYHADFARGIQPETNIVECAVVVVVTGNNDVPSVMVLVC